jgi:hypothetical protein
MLYPSPSGELALIMRLLTRCFRLLLALIAGLAWLPAPRAGAQSAASAVVTAVDPSAFPEIQAFALVDDAAGQHLTGLAARDFTLTENGQPVSNLTVEEAALGIQLVFVIDTSEAFKARDANGNNRLNFIKLALAEYARTDALMQAGINDVTILAPEGPIVQHSSDGDAVAHAVEAYQTDFAGAADPFPLLNSALDFASDATGRPGMRRFVVLMSNGFMRPDSAAPLEDAGARAATVQVPIHTVFVGPGGAEDTASAQSLKKLSELSGGQRLIFENAKSLAPLFQLLADQGRQYRLVYRSGLAVTGQHELSLSVALPDGETVSSSEVIFPLRVEAPMVALGGVPASLVRVAASANSAAEQAEPAVFEVPVQVDFPDGHPRRLALIQLVVDGEIAASQANVDSVTSIAWPLAAYADSASHTLQVRLADELGLAAESSVTTVSVSLQRPAAAAAPAVPERAAAALAAGWPLLMLALGGVLLAAAIGVGAWLSISRRRAAEELAEDSQTEVSGATRPVQSLSPTRPAPRVTRVTKAQPAPPAAAPAKANGHGAAPGELGRTQPSAEPRRTGSRLPHVSLPHFNWRGRGPAQEPRGPAFLEVIEPGGGGAPLPPIELAAGSHTLGRDAGVAETVFHDRSVSRLHARLVVADGVFRLYDAGSTSGTWINYTQVAVETGQSLEHGDLINLGRVQLRFQRRDRPPANGSGIRVQAVEAAGAAVPQHTNGSEKDAA